MRLSLSGDDEDNGVNGRWRFGQLSKAGMKRK